MNQEQYERIPAYHYILFSEQLCKNIHEDAILASLRMTRGKALIADPLQEGNN